MAVVPDNKLATFYRNEAHDELKAPFFAELNRFLNERLGGKCFIFSNKANSMDSERFQLTLHFRHENSVGITAIEFKSSRRGHCEALVNFLDAVSERYQIPLIEFVSVCTDSMNAFVNKHGFTLVPLSLHDDDIGGPRHWYRFTPHGKRRHRSSIVSTSGGYTHISVPSALEIG